MALARTYLSLAGFGVGILAVWLIVRGTANESTLYQVLLAIGVLVIGGGLVTQAPKAYSSLLVAPHQFAVRATDKAGNVDATPATWSWTTRSNGIASRYANGSKP